MISSVNEQPSSLDSPSSGWQTTLWREWCHTKDEEYAFYLYRLVNHTALGWKMVAGMSALGAVAGGVLGYWLGDTITTWGVSLGLWVPMLTPALITAWGLGMLGSVGGIWGGRELRAWYFWWQGQPPVAKVERALRQARKSLPGSDEVWDRPLEQAQTEKEHPRDLEELITFLDDRDWAYRFAARQALVARGGEAIPALQQIAADSKNPLWHTAIWVLTSIEQDTTNRFAWRLSDTYCPHCLAQYGRHPINLSLGVSFAYYGCRICGQSQQSLYIPQGSIAVLDASGKKEQTLEEGLLRVNWLLRRELFDFGRVEIVRATDEQVERFAVQVGNDTDPFRESRYPQLTCRIGPLCRLSENTLRILRRTFGQVEQVKPPRKRLREQEYTHDRLAEL